MCRTAAINQTLRGLFEPPFRAQLNKARLAQQSTCLCTGIIDFDLKHRISRLQFSTRCFCGVDGVELRLEMTIDNGDEPVNRGSVGSKYFLRLRLFNRENRFFHLLNPFTVVTTISCTAIVRTNLSVIFGNPGYARCCPAADL